MPRINKWQDASYNRQWNLKRKYKLTLKDFEDLLESQDGRCAICGSTEPGGRGNFHVDHDHTCCPGVETCGQCVRGLLCNSCNRGLGSLQDSIHIVRSAARYLESWARNE